MISLRDYQTDIVSRVFDAWRTCRSVMVQMPTGTGKTHVLTEVVRCLTPDPSPKGEGSGMPSCKNDASLCKNGMSLCNGAGDGSVWIVAHRRELVAQIEDTVGKMLVADSSLFPLRSSLIRVMSIQWLSRHWDDVEGRPGLVVIDEAHHARADSYRELWTRCPEAKFLGLTATPCRMNRSGFTDLFDTLVCSWSISEFIRKGRLSLFDYVSIRPDSGEQRLIDSLERRGADGDYQQKEMNAVLNSRGSIVRLYESMAEYAGGKKGIVYAIGIDHARSIAAYYNKKGVSSVAIDSRTPAEERRRAVEEFKAGRVRVLVNVDVFSEGFDCPDVEFVQMARPTLSLAKYLQQVGRGLRRSEGKTSCVLIDNVGLYRVFGLPTVAWDWEAMFRGEVAGKGVCMTKGRHTAGTLSVMPAEAVPQDGMMEVIVSHDNLLSAIEDQDREQAAARQKKALQTDKSEKNPPELKAWQDEESGYWGLRCGRRKTTGAVYAGVFDIRYNLVAVRFMNNNCGLVNTDGMVVWEKGNCRSMRFAKHHFLTVETTDGHSRFVDLYGLRMYNERPEVRRFGDVEMLKVGQAYYSRTKRLYVNNHGLDGDYVIDRKYYVLIFDYKTPSFHNMQDLSADNNRCGYVCLLSGDHESFYYIHCWLADGSIIVADDAGRYYHAADGRGREYIGCCDSAENMALCRTAVDRISRQAQETRRALDTERKEKRLRLLDKSGDAVPFRSGMKWGLKIGGRVTVPPVYRNVRPPVGRYCAVEKNYRQWGVIAIDGTMLVEPKYQEIDIGNNGMAVLTFVTGEKVSVRLK